MQDNELVDSTFFRSLLTLSFSLEISLECSPFAKVSRVPEITLQLYASNKFSTNGSLGHCRFYLSIHETCTPLYFIRPSVLRKYLKNESIGRWLFVRLALLFFLSLVLPRSLPLVFSRSRHCTHTLVVSIIIKRSFFFVYSVVNYYYSLLDLHCCTIFTLSPSFLAPPAFESSILRFNFFFHSFP